MYSACRAPVVKRIIISTRKERGEKKTRNKQGLVALVNARKSKELLIILQTAANQLEAANSPWEGKKNNFSHSTEHCSLENANSGRKKVDGFADRERFPLHPNYIHISKCKFPSVPLESATFRLFCNGWVFFFSLNVQIWRRPPWLWAREATLKQQQQQQQQAGL